MASWAVIGIIVGILLGLTGSGGAVIAVPLFVYLADTTLRDATALSLIAVVTGAMLSWTIQMRNTDYRLAGWLIGASALGSVAFKPLKEIAPDWLLAMLFLAVASISLVGLWMQNNHASHKTLVPTRKNWTAKATASGFVLGGLITLTGLGGGVLLVPLLTSVFKLPMSQAAATSLFTIMVSSAFGLFHQRDWIIHQVAPLRALALISGSVLASLIAMRMVKSLSAIRLNRLRLILITLVILISAGSLVFNQFFKENITMKKPESIHMLALANIYQKLGSNDKILDVRTAEEFAEGHIPGALNIDHEIVANRAPELKQYDRIYLHCKSGKRAQMAINFLHEKGLQNIVLIENSGMSDWTAAGLPEAEGK